MAGDADLKGAPIPGFPGYTVDLKDDGTWGVRSWHRWRNHPEGRFLAEIWHNTGGPYIHLTEPKTGKQYARTPEAWARLAGVA